MPLRSLVCGFGGGKSDAVEETDGVGGGECYGAPVPANVNV